jgi:bis(5'-nucleosidyl)-tetraphosphatase
MDNMETEQQVSAGALLCLIGHGDIEVLLLTQNSAFYNRTDKAAVVDLGPKGQVKVGENEKDAALREIKEEVGLHIDLDENFREESSYTFDAISRITGKRAHISKKVVFFLAYITQEDVDKIKLSEEHLGCRLVNIDEAIQGTRHDGQKRILRVLKEYIEKNAQNQSDIN